MQLFESWALNLDEAAFRAQVIEPNRRIVEGVRAQIPDAAIIGFPRGAAGMVAEYAADTGVDAIGLDYAMPVAFADTRPARRLAGPGQSRSAAACSPAARQMEERAEAIIAGFANRPHIFNLGHGIVPADADRARRAAGRDRQRGPLMDWVWFAQTWVKALHVISVIAWIAGMMYLPRLFVYHAAAEKGSIQSETFKIMERRLYRGIITPAMVADLGVRPHHGVTPGIIDWSQGWVWVKAVSVILLSGIHGYYGRQVRAFADDRNARPQGFWRVVNEMPFVLVIIIVIMVIVQPF